MIKSEKYYLLKLFIFWMILFTASRAAFLLFLYSTSTPTEMTGWAASFYHGLPLDLSATAYLLSLPTLLYIIALSISGKRTLTALSFLNYILLFLILLILFCNLIVYKVWGTMINARVISFLQDPEGIIASASTFQLITFIAIILILYTITILILRKWCRVILPLKRKPALIEGTIFLLLLPILIRGGFGEIPINESASFYSTSMPLNHAATNPAWYLVNNLSKSGIRKENPFRFYTDQELLTLTQSIQNNQPENIKLITGKNPNIVLIVLESWSADLIRPMGGHENTTPFFNQLCTEGYLFTQIYSSGRRNRPDAPIHFKWISCTTQS